DGGWFAVAIGPYPRGNADPDRQRLISSGVIPSDSMVQPGKAYRLLVWGSQPQTQTKPVVIASRGVSFDVMPASAGVFVQIAIEKSEDEAKTTYHDLQVKFPTILGKLDPNIQRADLGDKGVYFRVRVGPFVSAADAQKVCGNYKAAGGDCA